VKPDNTGVVTEGVKMSVNPFDEIALEEALRIRERGGAEEVVVATVGPADTVRVTREVDAGLETLDVDLPAVITTDLRLNEPRYVKLPDIMKAKKKPLEVLPLASLGVATAPTTTVVRFDPPPQRHKGVMVKNAAELVAALHDKGLV
ncbi:MAG TPA: hypothetical protein VMC02_02395, partial [Steroidobacteraceae bacterium]|nr:hypothetical protein [Steroidobacteraceae bacterium]